MSLSVRRCLVLTLLWAALLWPSGAGAALGPWIEAPGSPAPLALQEPVQASVLRSLAEKGLPLEDPHCEADLCPEEDSDDSSTLQGAPLGVRPSSRRAGREPAPAACRRSPSDLLLLLCRRNE
jgi:hypothetical protein